MDSQGHVSVQGLVWRVMSGAGKRSIGGRPSKSYPLRPTKELRLTTHAVYTRNANEALPDFASDHKWQPVRTCTRGTQTCQPNSMN
jgi:hypothetical protein